MVALVLIAWPPSWALLRQVATTAHEAAHALVAVATGRSLTGIRLHRDTSGLTVTRGRPRGPGMVATLLAGYLGPGLVGLGGAALLAAGRAVLLLWLLLALMLALVLWVRNWFGLLSLVASAGVLYLVTSRLAEQHQSTFALLLVSFLLLAAPRAVLDLHRTRRRRGGSSSDADQMARLTRVPALAWVGFFGIGTIGCLVGGFALVLGRV